MQEETILHETVSEQPIKLNFSHYSTILDETIDLYQLKENISNIFTKRFDSFFSDLYPEKLDGEKEILKTNKEFDEENNSLKISGLEGLELGFKFIDNGGIKIIDLNINVGNTNLSRKQEMYLDVVFGYLKEFGLEFKSSNEFNKKITCSNGVCHFVQVVKEDLTDLKNNLNQNLLEAVLSGDGLKIKDLIGQIKDNELKKSLEDFLELSVKSFNNENINKELDVLKIKIIYKIISDNYKRLIYSLDSYIKSIESNEETRDKVGNERYQIGEKVNNIISEKHDKIVFLQVKTILEKNREIYFKKLNNLSIYILREQNTKQILEASVELGNELPIIIKNIEKEIPLNIKMKSKIFDILSVKTEIEFGENNEKRKKEEIEEKKQREFESIKNMIETEYEDKKGNILAYNYQLFLNNILILKNNYSDYYQYNGINEYQRHYLISFVIKDNKLKININGSEDNDINKGKHDVLTIINGQIIVKVNEIGKKYSEIINSNIYKFVGVYNYINDYMYSELLNTKNNKISTQNLGNPTGEYVEINGERFVQFNKNDITKYIGLENFYYLSNSNSKISHIDKSKYLLINGKKFYNAKDENEQLLIINFKDIKFYKHSSFSLEENYKNSYNIIKIIFNDKVIFRGEEYTKVIIGDENNYTSKEYYINKKGEFLEEIIQNKMKDCNTIIHEYYYDKEIKEHSLGDGYITITAKNDYTYKVNSIKNIFEKYITVDTEICTNNGERDDYILYFDGNNFLTEKYSGDLVIGLDEFKLDGNIFYKANLIKITDKITTRDNIILNEKFEALKFGDIEIIKFGDNFFEYHGKQYREVYLKYNSEPIFLNLSSKSKYTEKDQFIYEKYGKMFPIYEGKNKGEILKLLVEYNGGKTSVSVSNKKEKGKFNFFAYIFLKK